MRPLITLTTDFGHGSPYVAQMKGVVLSLCSDAILIDITHGIAPQNVREGAVVLADATPRFPPGTIHVAVVDPGVGTSRRLAYAEIGSQRYLAPDNGLLSLLAAQRPPARLIALENAAYWQPNPSRTFHGRDILAPTAAHIALGREPTELGPPLEGLIALAWPAVRSDATRAVGEVLYVDSFGNLITNLRQADLAPLGRPEQLVVECAGREIFGLAGTYGAAAPGEVIALYDSQDRLEVAVTGGSAARLLDVEPGASVSVRRV